MSLGQFEAANADKELKDKAVQQIEKGMSYCNDCETTSTDNLTQMCVKHKKMYGRLYP